MGLGGAIIWVPVPGIAARQFPPERRGLATGIAGVGIGVGIVFAGRIAFLRSGEQDVWQTLYRIELCIALIVIASAFVFLRSQGNGRRCGGFGGFGALRQVQGWKALTGTYSAYASATSSSSASPSPDSRTTPGGPPGAALAFTTIGFAVIAGGLIVGSISDRIGRRLTMTIAPVSWAVASIGILTGSLPVVLVSTVLVGIMFSGIPATIIAHVVAPRRRAVIRSGVLGYHARARYRPGGVAPDWRRDRRLAGSFTPSLAGRGGAGRGDDGVVATGGRH